MDKNKEAGASNKIAPYGMLIALAFIFSYIEALIPLPVPIPGIKIGLANLVSVVGLYTVGAKGTLLISLTRIILTGFTFGNASSMMYSLAGGMLSLGGMILAKKTNWFSSTGISILGGIFHNIGQLAMAAWVTDTLGVFTYLPVLLLAGVTAGAVIGVLGGMIVERIGRAARNL